MDRRRIPGAMSRPDVSSKRRLQAVEVARGRAGYGFTLTGQSPCLLSCVLKGSPAHFVGLRPGDHVLSVNDINVSKASHEDVVKLIGRCSGVLKMVIAEGDRSRRPSQRSNATGRHHHHHHHTAAAMPSYIDSCSSDEELDGYYDNGRNNGGGPRGGWAKPKMDPKQLGIDRAERVVAELQSGGIFNMIFENSSQSSSSSDKERPPGPRPSSKPRPPSEPDFLPAYRSASTRCHSNPNLLSEEEMAQVLQDDSVFLETDFRHLHLLHQEEPDLDPDADVGPGGADFGPDPHGDGILNVGMVVGYLGSIELASAGNSLENDSLQAIRGSMRRLRAEQKIHSLVLMKVMHDSVLLCSERGAVLASYPAEKLAFSACCPDDRRFFGLVTMQATDDHEERHFWGGRDDEAGLRTSCHVFIVDPELCHHQVHLGVARRFGFQCTPDPDTGGCLQFPPSSTPLLQFVSVLYRGGAGVRGGGGVGGAPPDPDQDPDQDPDPHQNHSTSSNSDSGIGNFLPEERINNRVLLVDLGGHAHNHTPGSGPRPWDSSPPSSHTAWSPTFGAPPPTLTPPPPPLPPPPPPMLRNGHYWHDPHLAELPHPLPLALPLAPPQTRPPKPDLRNQTLETRLLKPDLRNQTPETRLLKPDLRNQTPETRLLKPDLRNQTPETRLLKPDLRNQTPETRLLKPDLRNQTLETRPPGPSGRTSRGSYKLGGGASGGGASGGGDWRGAGPEPQLWLPVHVLRDWSRQQPGAPPPPRSSDQESYAESTDGWSSANCSTLPPPMSKIPADRYRAPLAPGDQPPGPPPPGPPDPEPEPGPTHRMALHKEEWARKLFGTEREKRPGPRRSQREKKPGGGNKEGEKKGGRFRGLTMGFPPLPQRSSARRSFGRSKRLSMARSLDDLESAAVSDGELNSVELQGCSSDSLNSNASLPSVQSHRRHTERRVASWAVSFERLLQDPLGVRYFSEFLKKEFSEENILFWQACEFFSHVPENDNKQLSQRAREIYNSFLSSKATTPVNIDSQAQLADDILNAPRPDMFREQQLQIFNLMKFDSYTRFLKSLLYQECMLAEVEGRPLPDPHHVPSSPTSKHSTTGSDRSNLSTPKKEDKKSKSGRSLNEDGREDSGDRRKGMFFSWSRNRSFGKGPKKRELADFNFNFSGSNGRRESQGSLSSGASLELGTSGSGKNEGDSRGPVSERAAGGAPLRQCNINLPNGSCCSVPLRAGVSIRELLQGLCEKLCINLAAIDLFLVGGEKPLVLDQDCVTLCSRDLRLEKRTLFRLDLVPINRSVGLKAKPTKPVTEVLRPVVAKYGLHLSDLVARISGEAEPLDLGLPISNLDGLRVVLDIAETSPGKAASKTHLAASTSRNQSATGEDRPSRKAGSAHPKGENGKPDTSHRALPNHSVSLHKAPDKRKQKKINIDEAEEFFDLISKAQSNRADDQRGLLNKSDLQLPDFLRLSPTPAPDSSRNHGDSDRRRGNKANGSNRGSVGYQSHSLDSPLGSEGGAGGGGPGPPPFPGSVAPGYPVSPGYQAPPPPQEDALSDLTLVGEADINSPSLDYVTPSPLRSGPQSRPGSGPQSQSRPGSRPQSGPQSRPQSRTGSRPQSRPQSGPQQQDSSGTSPV
ncbi:LOW QUALITY PROTEIN: regulator of G-protein signaling 12b [Menidia menidia]